MPASAEQNKDILNALISSKSVAKNSKQLDNRLCSMQVSGAFIRLLFFFLLSCILKRLHYRTVLRLQAISHLSFQGLSLTTLGAWWKFNTAGSIPLSQANPLPLPKTGQTAQISSGDDEISIDLAIKEAPAFFMCSRGKWTVKFFWLNFPR